MFVFFVFLISNSVVLDFSVENKKPQRTLLTLDFLSKGEDISSTIDNTAFLPLGGDFQNTKSPDVGILGKITLDNFISKRAINVIYSADSSSNCFPQPFDEEKRRILPDFSFDFVSSDFDVVPTVRSYQTSDHPYWEYIPGPGKSWVEDGDNGFNRVALTFAITEKGQNCVYNGLISFLYKQNGETNAWYQINSQFCDYYQVDMWGFANLTYTPGQIQNENTVLETFKAEVKYKIPVKSIAYLARDANPLNPLYNVDSNIFNQGPEVNCTIYGGSYFTTLHECFSPSNIYGGTLNMYGVLYGGNFYRGNVMTRNGLHPYPEWYVYPHYSLGKSNFVGAAVGILDQMYPNNIPKKPGSFLKVSIFDLVVADWIPEATVNFWSDVTLGNVLDMASSHYNSSVYGVDENSDITSLLFFCNLTHPAKIEFSTQAWTRHSDPPGTKFGYKTSEFYIISRILESVIEILEPSVGGLVGFLKNYFYVPLGLSELHSNPKVTYDSFLQPFGGYGSFGYEDDMIKLAQFWTFQDGIVNNSPLVSRKYYSAAMQMNPTSRGVLTERYYDGIYSIYFPPIPIPNQRYHYGFWSKDGIDNSLCDNQKFVFESGYGGLSVIIARKKWALLQLSDNLDFIYDVSVNELASKLGCPQGLVVDGN